MEMRVTPGIRWLLRIGPIFIVTMLVLAACGEKAESPRERVLDFVKEVQKDTLPDISSYLDFDSVATYEYADRDSLTLVQKKDQLVRDFTGRGDFIRTWGRSQIVVNNQRFLDDTTANVEVSFIDRDTHVQYYSEMRLKKRNGWWIITDFRANQQH